MSFLSKVQNTLDQPLFVKLGKFGKFLGDTAQTIARSGGSVALTDIVKPLGGPSTIQPDQGGRFQQAFHRSIFGNEPVEDVATRMQQFPSRLADVGGAAELPPERREAVQKQFSQSKFLQSVAPLAIAGITVADLTGAGGAEKAGVKGAAKPSVIKGIAKGAEKVSKKLAPAIEKLVEIFKNFTDLSIKTLAKLEGKTKVSKQYIDDLAKMPELKQPERDLIQRILKEYPEGEVPVKEFGEKVQAELLPLKTQSMVGQQMFESTVLPNELRGNIAYYDERIYNSPIQVSPVGGHFNSVTENYFAHTRIEDLPNSAVNKSIQLGETVSNEALTASGGTTRRVIEIQSDLFQKGRLADETRQLETRAFPEQFRTEAKPSALAQQKLTELDKLQPYRNTWWERIIREETKTAAKDGKTKLQFPTGETAMKIEGLGENADNWLMIGRNNQRLRTGDLKTGEEIARVGTQDNWIITEVQDELKGTFKAVPKSIADNVNKLKVVKGDKAGEWFVKREDFQKIFFDKADAQRYLAKEKELLKTGNIAETFDISGKVDTSNPIYRFYEKDIQKYLKRAYPDMKMVTDPQGVTWWEISPTKADAKKPIEAFGALPFVGLDFQDNNQSTPESIFKSNQPLFINR